MRSGGTANLLQCLCNLVPQYRVQDTEDFCVGLLESPTYTGLRMFRSLVSIAVLLGFVAGQLAALPHAHAFASLAEQRQHDARPHVHVGHSHGHEHDHHHDSPSGEQEVPNDRSDGHDADALYLPATSGTTTSSVACGKVGQD